MRYSLEFTRSALKELQSLDRKMQLRVAARTSELCADPFDGPHSVGRTLLSAALGFDSSFVFDRDDQAPYLCS